VQVAHGGHKGAQACPVKSAAQIREGVNDLHKTGALN
jgi:hypothetical protein